MGGWVAGLIKTTTKPNPQLRMELKLGLSLQYKKLGMHKGTYAQKKVDIEAVERLKRKKGFWSKNVWIPKYVLEAKLIVNLSICFSTKKSNLFIIIPKIS